MIWVEVPYHNTRIGFLLDLASGIDSLFSPNENICWEVVEIEGDLPDQDYREIEQQAFDLAIERARLLYNTPFI